MDVLKGGLLALRFGLEITALVALGYWGFETGGSVTRWVLGIGAPAVAIVLWALFVSPKATYDHLATRAIFEFVVFAGAAAGLASAGRTTLAIAFAIVALIDSVLVRALGAQSATAPRAQSVK